MGTSRASRNIINIPPVKGTHIQPPVSKAKAGLILEEGVARGKKLTPKQKRFFGAIRGGSFGHPKRK